MHVFTLSHPKPRKFLTALQLDCSESVFELLTAIVRERQLKKILVDC